jgi:hypothetical protein
MRQQLLMEWAEAAAKNSTKTKEQHFKSMARAEATRAMFKKLKHIIKPEDKSGIKTIDVPVTHTVN